MYNEDPELLAILEKNGEGIKDVMSDNDVDTDEEQIKLEKKRSNDNMNEFCRKVKDNPNYIKENLK